MKTTVLWEQYQYYSRDLTDNSRKLAFAAGAICWLFKDVYNVSFPPAILWALAFLVVHFVCDILHYFIGALAIKSFTEAEEAKMWAKYNTIEREVLKPRSVDRWPFAFWNIKVVFLLLSFASIGVEFIFRIFFK